MKFSTLLKQANGLRLERGWNHAHGAWCEVYSGEVAAVCPNYALLTLLHGDPGVQIEQRQVYEALEDVDLELPEVDWVWLSDDYPLDPSPRGLVSAVIALNDEATDLDENGVLAYRTFEEIIQLFYEAGL